MKQKNSAALHKRKKRRNRQVYTGNSLRKGDSSSDALRLPQRGKQAPAQHWKTSFKSEGHDQLGAERQPVRKCGQRVFCILTNGHFDLPLVHNRSLSWGVMPGMSTMAKEFSNTQHFLRQLGQKCECQEESRRHQKIWDTISSGFQIPISLVLCPFLMTCFYFISAVLHKCFFFT